MVSIYIAISFLSHTFLIYLDFFKVNKRSHYKSFFLLVSSGQEAIKISELVCYSSYGEIQKTSTKPVKPVWWEETETNIREIQRWRFVNIAEQELYTCTCTCTCIYLYMTHLHWHISFAIVIVYISVWLLWPVGSHLNDSFNGVHI